MPILYCYVLWFEVWYCLCITMYCGMYCVMYWWYVLNTYQHVLNTKIMHSTHFHEKMMRAKTDHKLNTSHTTIQANSKETYWHVLPRPMCPNTDTGLTVSQPISGRGLQQLLSPRLSWNNTPGHNGATGMQKIWL